MRTKRYRGSPNPMLPKKMKEESTSLKVATMFYLQHPRAAHSNNPRQEIFGTTIYIFVSAYIVVIVMIYIVWT
jgi:hypothetical protein